MSRMPGDPEMDELVASEKLEHLLGPYGIIAPSHVIRALFQNRWGMLSSLAHMLHDAQERSRRARTLASENEDELVSG